MANNQYHIDYFYKHSSRDGRRYEGALMMAMDKGGIEQWEQLKPEGQATLTETVRTAFAAPYHSKTTETPGGSSNVKNVYEVSQFYPEGHLTVGMWWDRHMGAEEYYRKIGYTIESAGIGEGVRGSKEVRR